jgi:hypothetical protein
MLLCGFVPDWTSYKALEAADDGRAHTISRFLFLLENASESEEINAIFIKEEIEGYEYRITYFQPIEVVNWFVKKKVPVPQILLDEIRQLSVTQEITTASTLQDRIVADEQIAVDETKMLSEITGHADVKDNATSEVVTQSTCNEQASVAEPDSEDYDPFRVDGLTKDEFVAAYVENNSRENPGVQKIWETRDRVAACGVWYMRLAIKADCRCRHDKLAHLAYTYAQVDKKFVENELLNLEENQDENKIYHPVDLDRKRWNLKNLFKEEAKKLVPPERIQSSNDYNPEKCDCPDPKHSSATVKRSE